MKVLSKSLLIVLCFVISSCGRTYDASTGDDIEDGGVYIECEHHIDCNHDEECIDQICIPIPDEEQIDSGTVCTTSNDCPFGMFCDLSISLCVNCLIEDHCDTGLVCIDGNCVEEEEQPEEECQYNSDCPVGYNCVNHECVPISNQGLDCTTQSDCDVYGRVCVDGECIPCGPDVACPGDRVCSAGICTEPNSGGGSGGGVGGGGTGEFCISYADCPNYLACDAMTFTCFECYHDDQCNNILDMVYGGPAYCCLPGDVANGWCPSAGSCVPW